MRCFIGLEIPMRIKLEIFNALAPLYQKNGKGWEDLHDYHQTLLFIGEVSNEQVDEIKSRMSSISFSPFTLTSSGIKFFNRRIMYLDFFPSNELMKLHQKILALFPEWVRPLEKEFVPHMTIKRWQRYEFEDLFSGTVKLELKSLSFEVRSVALYKSERDQNNKKYHIIHQIFSSPMTL